MSHLTKTLLFFYVPVSSYLVLGFSPLSLFLYLTTSLLLILSNIRQLYRSSSFSLAFTSSLILFFQSIVNLFSYGEVRYFIYALFFPLSFSVGLLARSQPKFFTLGSLFSLATIQLFLFLHLSSTSFQPGYSYDEIIEGVSSNGFTTLLILLSLFYMIRSRVVGLLCFFQSCILLFFCIYGYGRASVVSSVVILLSFLLDPLISGTRLLFTRLSISLSRTVCLISFVFLLLLISSFDIQSFLQVFTKFRFDTSSSFLDAFSDPSRSSILADYIRHLDLVSLIFGNDSPTLLFHRSYDGNPHNSFLNSHRLFGFTYILSIIFVYLKLNRPFPSQALAPQKIIFFAVALFRCFSEPYILASPLDVLLFSTPLAAIFKTPIQSSIPYEQVSSTRL